MSGVPILCYHHIGTAPADAPFKQLYVSERQFDRHLSMLRRFGWRGARLGECIQKFDARTHNRLIAITIDDGYDDALIHAAPILRRHGFTATCFVVSGLAGGSNTWDIGRAQDKTPLMSVAQLRQWVDAGMEVGSHSLTHQRLDKLDETAAWHEIAESRRALGSALGVMPEYFCYPFGRSSDAVVELTRRAGYRAAVTTQYGIARATDDRHALPRILVPGHDNAWFLLRKILLPYEAWSERLRQRYHGKTTSLLGVER